MLVLRNASGAELNTLSYSVAGQANLSRSLERNTELQVQLDKTVYSGGDTIEVSIRAPYVGAGLITIERERVFHHQWFKTTTTSSVQRVTLPAGLRGQRLRQRPVPPRSVVGRALHEPAVVRRRAVRRRTSTARTQPVTLTAPQQVKPGTPLTHPADDARAVARRGARGRRRHPAGRALPQPGSARLLLPEAHARGRDAADPRPDPARLQALPGARGAWRRRRRRLRAASEPVQPQAQGAGRLLVRDRSTSARAGASCATPCPTTSTAGCASSPSAVSRGAHGRGRRRPPRSRATSS